MIDLATPLAHRTPPAQSPARKLRLGFAGVGWIGRHRLNAILAGGQAEVAAVVDPALAPEDPLLEQHPQARRMERFEELLDAGLDGLVIATPSALHARQASAALESGIPVFCQKPLGRDLGETASVVAAARAADRLLGVDLSYRFTAGMQAIREQIHAGSLGRITAIEAKFHNSYGPDKPWFYNRSEAGGGCLLDLGIHLVDLALWCLDFPAVRRAAAWIDPPDAGEQVETHATGQVLLDGNVSLQLATSWRAPLGCDAEIQLRFFGDNGSAVFHNINGSFLDFAAELVPRNAPPRRLAEAPDDWGGRAALGWVRALSVSKRFDPEIDRIEQVAGLIDDLYHSARSA